MAPDKSHSSLMSTSRAGVSAAALRFITTVAKDTPTTTPMSAAAAKSEVVPFASGAAAMETMSDSAFTDESVPKFSESFSLSDKSTAL